MAKEVASLPMKSILDVAKRSLAPYGGKVSGDGKTALSYASAIFICYVTATAQEICARRSKSAQANLRPADITQALHELQMEDFVDHVNAALEVYRDAQSSKRKAKRPRTDDGDAVADLPEEAGEEAGEEQAGEDSPEEDDELAGDGDADGDVDGEAEAEEEEEVAAAQGDEAVEEENGGVEEEVDQEMTEAADAPQAQPQQPTAGQDEDDEDEQYDEDVEPAVDTQANMEDE